MNAEVARGLEFGAHQALQQGRALLAELYALQLDAALAAECTADPAAAALLAGPRERCRGLLSRADASAEAAEDRWVLTTRVGAARHARGALQFERRGDSP
jgi:hypothetical protein